MISPTVPGGMRVWLISGMGSVWGSMTDFNSGRGVHTGTRAGLRQGAAFRISRLHGAKR